jgi:hypothetical protein
MTIAETNDYPTVRAADARDLVKALRETALLNAQAYPFSTADRRTSSFRVQPTPGKLRLDVIASYCPRAETMCLYGNRQAAETIQRQRPVVVVYRCWHQGDGYILTEDEAVALIVRGKLPVPERPALVDDGSDPFAGLGQSKDEAWTRVTGRQTS